MTQEEGNEHRFHRHSLDLEKIHMLFLHIDSNAYILLLDILCSS